MFGGGRSKSDIAAGRFDCSSFVRWAYEQAGVNVGSLTGTTTDTLKKKGTKVSYKDIQVGDMVFFDTYKKDGHVGIYVGNGKFIGAQSSTGVAVADMSSGYWKKKFNGNVRRIGGMGSSGTKAAASSKAKTGSYKTQTSYKGNLNKLNQVAKNPAANKAYQGFKKDLSKAIASGGVPAQWAVAMAELVGRESDWNTGAKNPKSTASGYAQFLKSTIKQYEKKTGLKYKGNGVNQLIMMVHYVKDRYGTPEKALAFWDKHNYY